ncbi:hypothetical protein CK203_052748 [Vitis vinifera]|uniref:Endonuclease/exonuclease/phosphatase domain-containing protein n=1 Tax=Vitis vinifera TaxID=29760 RepID=A0A438FUV2_VITVI|nr:hypothetical protein CK203_052748 [Vitis vinifera]
MSSGIVRSLGVERHLDWRAVNSTGAAGGILVFWDNRVVELVELEEGEFSILRGVLGGALGQLKVYGVTHGVWEGISIGRYPEECNRGEGLIASMRRFSEVVEDLELRDFPLKGGPFTWRGVERHLDWRAVNSRGAAGGILVFWDNRVVELVELEEGEFSILDREVFWEELRSIKGLWSDPWCVGGDFNLVRYPEECNRGEGLIASMRRFSEVVEDLELRDFPLKGGPFTWRGDLNNQSQFRLDRFLVTDNWDSLCKGVVQGVLPRLVFDHFPVLLEGGGLKRGPSPFRFENMWLEEEGFQRQVEDVVGGFKFYRDLQLYFRCNIKSLKDILKKWNKEVFGLIETKKGENSQSGGVLGRKGEMFSFEFGGV